MSIMKNYNRPPSSRGPFRSKTRRKELPEEGASASQQEEQDQRPEGAQSLTEALAELAEGRVVRDETIRAVEETPEWQNYEAEVDFEMQLLRQRYTASGQKLTPARRQQMSAHLEQVQHKVMDEHASIAAENFTASLTSKEKDELRELFGKLHADGVELAPPTMEEPTMGLDESLYGFQESVTDMMYKAGRIDETKYNEMKEKIARERETYSASMGTEEESRRPPPSFDPDSIGALEQEAERAGQPGGVDDRLRKAMERAMAKATKKTGPPPSG